jgi:hypothetical protein
MVITPGYQRFNALEAFAGFHAGHPDGKKRQN